MVGYRQGRDKGEGVVNWGLFYTCKLTPSSGRGSHRLDGLHSFRRHQLLTLPHSTPHHDDLKAPHTHIYVLWHEFHLCF